MPWHVGIDENGLGPQLGPLVVTAVLAEVTTEAGRSIEADSRAFFHDRLADSKQLVDHRHVALAEAWARTLAGDPPSPEAVVRHLALEPLEDLQGACPSSSKPMCWHVDGEHFVAGGTDLDRARSDMDQLRSLGVHVRWARCSIVCVKRLNDAHAMGIGRLDMDLRAMEALILAARAEAGTEIVARCGKVGGLTRYMPKFDRLSSYPVTVIEEQRAQSGYRMSGIGRVHFLRDAEERDPLVSLASLVGKWMREVLMGRIVRYHRGHDDTLPDASGYNDPVTNRFMDDSAEIRRKLGIADTCFARARAKKV